MSGSAGATRKRCLSVIVGLLAVGLGATGSASASLAVGPGSTFSTSYIDLPEGALPGGNSGYFGSGVDQSSISSNGRYVAFSSEVNSMAPGANPDYTNVYRKDRQTGEVELVSRASGANGAGAAGHSYRPRISADGNLVAFVSEVALDPADVDDVNDIYVRNLTTNTTTLATPGTTGEMYFFDLSANGLYVAFNTNESFAAGDTNGVNDVYRRNLFSGVIDLVSRKAASPNAGVESSDSPAISGDGRWVAFASDEDALTAPFTDANGGSPDVFVRDMNNATNYLVSSKVGNFTTGGNGESSNPSIAGTPGNAPAGVKVSYDSYATDISPLDASGQASIYQGQAADFNSLLISRSTGGVNANSRANGSEMSDDGKLVLFSTDATNLTPGAVYYGAYVRNLSDGTTKLLSNDTEYAIAADISGDGSRVAWFENGGFTPDSDENAGGVFTRPAGGGTAEFTSRPAGNAPVLLPGAAYVYSPNAGTRTISADGRYVAFVASSTRLPGGTPQPQAYRRDLRTGEVELASRATGDDTPASSTDDVSISADGTRVGFTSYSSLDPADGDTDADIYVRDFSDDTTTLASRADGPAGPAADQPAEDSMLSGDGERIVFSTGATNLGVPGGDLQVYVRDLASDQTILVSRDASADPGVAGNGDSEGARISGDGQTVAFESRATNLDPADAVNNRDIYVRDLAGNKTTLVSRLGGLAGAPTLGFKSNPAISADGKVVAFQTDEQPIAPEAGLWPAGPDQVVSRVIATGVNTLVSRAPGGAAAETGGNQPSVDADGSVIAFTSDAANLKLGLGGDGREAVFARQSATGALSGPPTFGQLDNEQGAYAPSISDNGQCLAFRASGFNQASGDLSDLRGAYVHVVSGTCSDPRKNPVVPPPPPPPGVSKPKLTKVKLTRKKFRVSGKKTAKVAAKKGKKKRKKSPKGTKVKFTVSVDSSVTMVIEQKTKGRKVKGKCRKAKRKFRKRKKCNRFVKAGKFVRKNQQAGARTVAFSGRIGKKKLKPGKYRIRVTAYNSAGASNKVYRPFRVVRR